MPSYFFITGLPRSRTAWLCALFNTHEDVICLHEPINDFGNWEAIKTITDGLPYKYVGIADSSLALHSEFFIENFIEYPLLVVERNESDVIKSLSKFLSAQTIDAENIVKTISFNLNILLRKIYNFRQVKYEKLNSSSVIKSVFNYCIPDIKVNENKIAIFQNLLINQHKEKVISSMELNNQNILNSN